MLLALLPVLLMSCGGEAARLSTPHMELALDNRGDITRLSFTANGADYTPNGVASPLMRLYLGGGRYVNSDAMAFDESTGIITLTYPNGSVATISTETKGNYLKIRLEELTARDSVEAIAWGPYSTRITDQIGETIGVVRDSIFAFGIQGLDINTVEGMPDNEDGGYGGSFIDPLPGQELPDSLRGRVGEKIPFVNVNVLGDMPEYVRLWRGGAAAKNATGSEVRLFARDWKKPRTLTLGPRRQYVEPIDVDFIGSGIAMFGCPEPQTLDLIEEIELGEGLPHPMIDGVWLKRWDKANQAYMLYEGGSMDNAMDYADSCNFKLIHAGDMFSSWGHFGLTSNRYPGGADQIKAMTDKARSRGISIGVHTLTMFTSRHDPYITPVPSDSLCKAGSSTITADITADATEIPIADTEFFAFADHTRTTKIGKELIGYSGVSTDQPLRLLNCVRGQFGTKAATHSTGDVIDKLVNDDYSGFFPDIKLQDAYADRLAAVCSETGVDLMDFDGFGGGSPTGHGCYGAGLFLQKWYAALDKYRLTCGAGTFHYGWHLFAFGNWGEPWYDNLRQSQVNYRLENQRYFKRNLLPGMLGWFKLEASYRPEDIEWIQARSAGFDAGYLLRVDEGVERSGFKSQLFESIREWQKARNSHSFTADQITRMQNPKTEFHLEKADGGWNLSEVYLQGDKGHKYRDMQTGEPLLTKHTFDNRGPEQPVQFYAYIQPGESRDGKIRNMVLNINDFQPVTIPGTLQAGDKIYCDGTRVYVCDEFWNAKLSEPLVGTPIWAAGANTAVISCDFDDAKAPSVVFEFKALGAAEKVVGK